MTSLPAVWELPLFDESELEAMVVERTPPQAIPRGKKPLVEFREFHGWTLDKLDVFSAYLNMYRRVAGGGAFIDAFAGTGLGVPTDGDEHERSDGSSIIAAKSGAFSQLCLIEKNSANVTALTTAAEGLPPRLSEKVSIHEGDCNKIIPELISSRALDESRPCFALFDQESTQLDWTTVETLSQWKVYEPPATPRGRPKKCKVELWILFNSHQAVNRLWPSDREKYPESFSPATLDRVFGGRCAWWDMWEDRQPASMLIVRFAERLRGLGYRYVLPQLFIDRATSRPQYHMIHATDHPSAISLMRWAKSSTDGHEERQIPGFETDTRPQTSR